MNTKKLIGGSMGKAGKDFLSALKQAKMQELAIIKSKAKKKQIMHKLSYPAILRKEKEGGYVVQFPDLPEAITQGESIKDALYQAEDCLKLVIGYRIDKKLGIPSPSKIKKARYVSLWVNLSISKSNKK